LQFVGWLLYTPQAKATGPRACNGLCIVSYGSCNGSPGRPAASDQAPGRRKAAPRCGMCMWSSVFLQLPAPSPGFYRGHRTSSTTSYKWEPMIVGPHCVPSSIEIGFL
jgi:hypothetical protein